MSTAFAPGLSGRAPSDKAPRIIEAVPIPAALVAVVGLWMGANGDDSQASYGLFQAFGGFVVVCLIVFVVAGGLGWVVAGRPFIGAAIWLTRLFGFCLILAGWADLHEREAAFGGGSWFVAEACLWGIGTSVLSALALGRLSPDTGRAGTWTTRTPEAEARRRVWTSAALELIPVAAAVIAVGMALFVDRESVSQSLVMLALGIMAFILFLVCVPVYFASGGGWMLLGQTRIGLAIGIGRALLLTSLALVFFSMSTRECIDCVHGPSDSQLWAALAVTTAIPMFSSAALLLTQSGARPKPRSGVWVSVRP